MKATLTKQCHTGKILQNRKEKSFWMQYSLVSLTKNAGIVKLASLRLYGSNRIYACLWVNASPVHVSGGGSASGYGYHKPSAAASEAFTDAGIVLDEDIAGGGDESIRAALVAVGEALGYETFNVIEAHA